MRVAGLDAATFGESGHSGQGGEQIGRTELFQANPLSDCRNSTYRAPATNNQKPGLAPGFFVPAYFLFDVR